MQRLRSHDRLLIAILILALGLRLGYALAQDHESVFTRGGGDSRWYLQNGYTLVTGDDPADRHEMSRLPSAPLYLLLIGLSQAIFSQTATAIIVIRLVQALLGTATVYLGYRIAVKITGERAAGLLTALVLAVSLGLIIETAKILTETLYIFLVLAGLAAYVDYASAIARRQTPGAGLLVLTGLMIGLATLTRAVLLLFPLGLALHLVLLHGWRRGLRQAALLLVVYGLVVSSWTIYNLARWNRLVVGSEGLASFIYVGSRGWDDPQDVDQALSEDLADNGENTDPEDLKQSDNFLTAARRVIEGDPVGYVKHRVSELARAYAQPHGTLAFSGKSLKDSLRTLIKKDRTPGGLIDLVRGEGFWPKLTLYVFHFGGLLLGVVGMWSTRRQWRITLPLIGFVVYTTLVHLVLLALPRYVFPIYPVFWIFAAALLAKVWQR